MTLVRHIDACTNAVLPGRRRQLFLGPHAIGFVDARVFDARFSDARFSDARLFDARLGDGRFGDARLADQAALDRLVAVLVEAGACALRGEPFDVRAAPGGEVLATVDRGALPALGVMAAGVHLNGLVRRADGVWVWVARRSEDKKLDPGKLDHLVGGGVSAGMSADDTLAKEAAEEAGMPPELIAQARHVGRVGYAMERPEGLRRDVLDCYDIDLPESFAPRAMDGEVAGFELWPLAAVVDRVRRTDEFKFNVNLVLIDLFLRIGALPDAEEVRSAMRRVYAPGGAASIGISRASTG